MGELIQSDQAAGFLAIDKGGPEDEQDNQFLTFRIGDETFAINVLGVKSIIEYGDMTTVPMMPDFVRGVINLRGKVVPAIDMAGRFGWQSREPTRRTCIVILEGQQENEDQDVGIIVDSVCQVVEIPEDNIEPPPAFNAKLRTDFICGMGKVEAGFVIILNSERVLSVEEMTRLANQIGQDDVTGQLTSSQANDEAQSDQ